MKIIYLAELIFPTNKAYGIHVMKMCNALSKKFKVDLIIFKNKEKKIFRSYNCKNKFNIIDKNLSKINFINRLIYCLSLFKNISSKKDIIISRSIISALFLSLFGYNIVLEIHHELRSFTKYLFFFSKYFYTFKNIKFIFISKTLKNKYNLKNKYLILDDAVELEDYSNLKNSDKFKNTCCYTGSLSRGKGLEKIFKISKKLEKINFHIYGDFSNSDFNINDFKNYKNVFYKGYIKYNKIPSILNKYHVVLMPYSKKVLGRGKNLEIGKYMSPMKLFDYLASGKIIIASKLKVYSHILNKKNSILIEENAINKWTNKIDLVFKKIKKFNYLKKNSRVIINKYTWDMRVKKIIDFINV